jgi:hypothetical protein
MAVSLVIAAYLLLLGQAAARVDLSALRSQDKWPAAGTVSGLTVDLGYGIYQGYNNVTSGLNIWKGYASSIPSSNSQVHLDSHRQHSICRASNRRPSLASA